MSAPTPISIYTPQQTNDRIRELLTQKKVFVAGKMGDGEAHGLFQGHFREQYALAPTGAPLFNPRDRKHTSATPGLFVGFPDHIRRALHINAGVFPDDADTLRNWAQTQARALQHVDIIARWVQSSSIQNLETALVSTQCPRAEPCALRGLEPQQSEMPWTLALHKKRILVISPFTDTMKEQLKRKADVWGDLADAQLPKATWQFIKAPLSGGLVRHKKQGAWQEALEDMGRKIIEKRPDVVLVGAGAYSLPLCQIAKRSGAAAIHLGGALQILFGIRGRRWDVHPIISQFQNDAWVRPSGAEVPADSFKVEGGCYW